MQRDAKIVVFTIRKTECRVSLFLLHGPGVEKISAMDLADSLRFI